MTSAVQVDVASQFFVGFYGGNGQYIDDISAVARKVLTSVNGFWFDFFTSVPWSYLDLLAYRVHAWIRVLLKLKYPSTILAKSTFPSVMPSSYDCFEPWSCINLHDQFSSCRLVWQCRAPTLKAKEVTNGF